MALRGRGSAWAGRHRVGPARGSRGRPRRQRHPLRLAHAVVDQRAVTHGWVVPLASGTDGETLEPHLIGTGGGSAEPLRTALRGYRLDSSELSPNRSVA